MSRLPLHIFFRLKIGKPPPYDHQFRFHATEHSKLLMLSLDFASPCALNMLRDRPPRHGLHFSTKFSVAPQRSTSPLRGVGEFISVDNPKRVLMCEPTASYVRITLINDSHISDSTTSCSVWSLPCTLALIHLNQCHDSHTSAMSDPAGNTRHNWRPSTPGPRPSTRRSKWCLSAWMETRTPWKGAFFCISLVVRTLREGCLWSSLSLVGAMRNVEIEDSKTSGRFQCEDDDNNKKQQ